MVEPWLGSTSQEELRPLCRVKQPGRGVLERLWGRFGWVFSLLAALVREKTPTNPHMDMVLVSRPARLGAE
jgi:hypothetical protein